MARYPMAIAQAVTTSGTGTYTATLNLGTCQRGTLWTYATRAGTNQVSILDASGNWRAFGSTDAISATTLRGQLIDVCLSQIRVTYTEGGVGAAVVDMHFEAVE